MARIITKELAIVIAAKLKAVRHPKKNRPHDLYVVYYGTQRVAQFGIRRTSDGDKGHDFIPRQIHVSTSEARDLGQCPMSYDDWVSIMKEKRIIPKSPAELAVERDAEAKRATEEASQPPINPDAPDDFSSL